jgi:HD-like signal output (HDOD) protein
VSAQATGVHSAKRPPLPQIAAAEIARAIEKLPALPPSATRLLAVLGKGDWHIDDVLSTISLDPVLTGRTLALANSASYASLGAVATVRQAIGRLGIGTVTSIAVAVAVHSTLRDPLRAYGASADLLWRHSVAASVAVEGIPAALRWTPPAESATAALLHDIGKLLLSRELSRAAAEFIANGARETGRTTAEVESELLGTSHAELGARIAEVWRLPSSIVQGIRFHHACHLAARQEDLAVARAVATADAVARSLVPGLGEAEEEWGLARDCEAVHVPLEALERLAAAAGERLADVLRLYES